METRQFELMLAAVYVQLFEQLISEHRDRIQGLQQRGASTLMAEKLLAVLQESLERMEQHLIFVTAFVPTEDRPTIDHANENES